MPGKLERIVFSDATAAIFVKKKPKGTRSTKRHATRGRNGTDNISIWGEVIGMIEDKGLAVSAPLDLLAASEILSCFGSQEKADLDRIRAQSPHSNLGYRGGVSGSTSFWPAPGVF
jgi:hypothetical protein